MYVCIKNINSCCCMFSFKTNISYSNMKINHCSFWSITDDEETPVSSVHLDCLIWNIFGWYWWEQKRDKSCFCLFWKNKYIEFFVKKNQKLSSPFSLWLCYFKIDIHDFSHFSKEYCLTADEKKEVESLLPSDKPEDIKKKFELIQEIIGENHVHPHEEEYCLDVSEENIIKLQKLLKEKDLAIANKGIQLMYKGFAGKMKKKE